MIPTTSPTPPPLEIRDDSSVSVVIPALDEGDHVETVVRAVDETMAGTGWTYEIVVVDDGSSDGTSGAAREAGARVVRNPRTLGYGAALKRGIDEARGSWLLIIDADGTYPAEAIPSLLSRTEESHMVVGARRGDDLHVSWTRRPAKWFLRRLASYLAGVPIDDLNSGLRLIRTDLVERYRHLLPNGFSFTTTITLAAACHGHPVVYVPIDYRKRLGDSKLRPWHAWDLLTLVPRTIVFFNPWRVFGPLGAVAALGGLVKFAWDLTRWNLSETAVLAFLGALVIWSVGLLADQNSRIVSRR